MSFFKASKKKEDVKSGGNSGYINASGCYPVNIIAPFANTSENNSTTVDFYLDHEGQKQVLYGNLRITNRGGATNEIGFKTFNQLAIIADVEDVADPVDAELPIGKDGKDKDVGVLEDLVDVDVILRVQMEYSTYNKNIQESKVIKGFYRAEDNASAEEIVNETEAGVQFEKDSKYFNNITYKDGLDEATVKEWIDAGRPKGTAKESGSAAPAKKPSFGNKKAFGKK